MKRKETMLGGSTENPPNVINGVGIPIYTIRFRFGNDKCNFGKSDFYGKVAKEGIESSFIEHILLGNCPKTFCLYKEEAMETAWAKPAWHLQPLGKQMEGNMDQFYTNKFPQHLINKIEKNGTREVIILDRTPWRREEDIKKGIIYLGKRMGVGITPYA